MSTYPTVADMLSIIGVAFLITVVLTTVLGLAVEALSRRRVTPTATVTSIPAQREATPAEHPASHAA